MWQSTTRAFYAGGDALCTFCLSSSNYLSATTSIEDRKRTTKEHSSSIDIVRTMLLYLIGFFFSSSNGAETYLRKMGTIGLMQVEFEKMRSKWNKDVCKLRHKDATIFYVNQLNSTLWIQASIDSCATGDFLVVWWRRSKCSKILPKITLWIQIQAVPFFTILSYCLFVFIYDKYLLSSYMFDRISLARVWTHLQQLMST